MIKIEDEKDYGIVDKLYSYVKDPNEAKFQYLTKNIKK